ncbi:MAG: NUDIX hydrolase [Bacteroidetes bacterium GWA2_31_9]|nr:MAG: NUDIX hydrolase [Bacteroidetes bacterium GWA2_31_9]
MSFTYEYPRPALTADCIILHKLGKSFELLLIKRKHEPFENHWALPGGFMDMDETIENAASRELLEETGLIIENLKQFKTYSSINRDPRGRTVSVIFYGFVDENQLPKAGDDATEVKWFNINDLPKLAFDHETIINEFKLEVLK